MVRKDDFGAFCNHSKLDSNVEEGLMQKGGFGSSKVNVSPFYKELDNAFRRIDRPVRSEMEVAPVVHSVHSRGMKVRRREWSLNNTVVNMLFQQMDFPYRTKCWQYTALHSQTRMHFKCMLYRSVEMGCMHIHFLLQFVY